MSLVSTVAFGNEVLSQTVEVDQKKESKSEEVLKKRQRFNKLKRSTRNIYKVTMRSTVTYRLQTALGHVSVIDLPEEALKVFVGDQELFKVEVYEKQILIKPITDEPDAATNLVVITDSSRVVFQVLVGPPETADFVLDYRLPQNDETLVQNAFKKRIKTKVSELELIYQAQKERLSQDAEDLSKAKLKEKVASGVETIELNRSVEKENIEIKLISLSQVADKTYLRFSIQNTSNTPYEVLSAVLGVETYERKFFRKRKVGFITFPAELSLPEVINPNTHHYGVLILDHRYIRKRQKAVFRMLENAPGSSGRNIQIKGFRWFK